MPVTLACHTCGALFRVPPSRATKARYCSYDCQAAAKRIPLDRRFAEKVDRDSDPDGCWPWTGDRDENGYGRLWDGASESHYVYAHRLAISFANGLPVADVGVVRHICDNPPCVRVGPLHLIAGTQAENIADRDAKDRVRHGSRHASAKLTETQVRTARELYAARKMSGRGLARAYGVSHSTMREALNGLSWRRA